MAQESVDLNAIELDETDVDGSQAARSIFHALPLKLSNELFFGDNIALLDGPPDSPSTIGVDPRAVFPTPSVVPSSSQQYSKRTLPITTTATTTATTMSPRLSPQQQSTTIMTVPTSPLSSSPPYKKLYSPPPSTTTISPANLHSNVPTMSPQFAATLTPFDFRQPPTVVPRATSATSVRRLRKNQPRPALSNPEMRLSANSAKLVFTTSVANQSTVSPQFAATFTPIDFRQPPAPQPCYARMAEDNSLLAQMSTSQFAAASTNSTSTLQNSRQPRRQSQQANEEPIIIIAIPRWNVSLPLVQKQLCLMLAPSVHPLILDGVVHGSNTGLFLAHVALCLQSLSNSERTADEAVGCINNCIRVRFYAESTGHIIVRAVLIGADCSQRPVGLNVYMMSATSFKAPFFRFSVIGDEFRYRNADDNCYYQGPLPTLSFLELKDGEQRSQFDEAGFDAAHFQTIDIPFVEALKGKKPGMTTTYKRGIVEPEPQ